jgi:zinc protease
MLHGCKLSFVAGLAALSAAIGLNAAPAAAVNTPPANVVRATLSNGLSVILVVNPLAPVITTVVNYKVGSDECPADFPGMAHATEHMMFRGSPGLSADQLADVTAGLGGDFDADTQQSITQYFFTAPAEDLEVALRLEAIRMRGLLSTDALWEKERGAIEQEVAQDLSNPEYVFEMKLLQAMFKGTPYEHDALGTRPSFDKTTGAMLQQFHNTWYAPNNAILVIAGDVQPARALAQVKKFFGGIPPSNLPPRPEFNFQPVTPETQKLDTDLPYGLIALTFRFPGSDSPDYAAAQILGDVLSSQRGKLYGLVPEGKALFAAFEYEGMQKAGLGYAVAGFPSGADSARRPNGGKYPPRNFRRIPSPVWPCCGPRRSRTKDASRRRKTSRRSGASRWRMSTAWPRILLTSITPLRRSSRRSLPANPFPPRASAAKNPSAPPRPAAPACRPGRATPRNASPFPPPPCIRW